MEIINRDMEIVRSAHSPDSESKDLQKRDNTGLLEELGGGSKAAFEELYHRFWERLYLAAYNMIRDKGVCEDIVQEIFVQLWIRRASLSIGNLEAYLFTAVRFQVFRYINERKCRNESVNELSKFPAEFFDDQLTYKEIEDAMKTGIAMLPEKCGKIFSLSRQQHLTNKEIAFRLNISIKTVENQMSIALRRMRKHLSPWILRMLWIPFLHIF